MIDSADVLYGIPDVDPIALKRAVDSNPRLRWVQVMAAGGGHQIKAARLSEEQLARVAFTTSAGVHGQQLAEFALFGLLAGAKTLPRLQSQQRRRQWTQRWEMRELTGQTVLVLGLGGIGQSVARLLSLVGMRVIGVSRHERKVEYVDELVNFQSIGSVSQEVDAIVVALPGTVATDGLIGSEFFSAVPPGITVVNVGRGTVIDEAALAKALDCGNVGFAALDVFAVEPLPASSPLWSHPNVLISPHTAALSEHEDRRIAELFAENASRWLDGDPLRNLVDTIEFY